MLRILTPSYKLAICIGVILRKLMFSQYSVDGLSTRASPRVRRVPKVDKDQFDQHIHYFHTHESNRNHPYETPVLVTNVISKEGCNNISSKILEELGENIVDLQRKMKVLDEDDNEVTETDIFQLELNEAFGYMMDSHHHDAFFCFCEGLLDSKSQLKNEREKLQRAKESLFVKDSSSSDETNHEKNDLFAYFPDSVKPSDCLVVAGEGATSTLHRDPFCWTGTSLCVEGTKIWRFIAPPGHLEEFQEAESSGIKYVDDALNSYRLPSVAWDDDYISSGWQSDMNLYSKRSDDLPSAEELAMMEEENPQQKADFLDDIASSLDSLAPSDDLPTHLDPERKRETHIWTVVQHPGDLLVIPAYWWHQTYAMEPSIAIASQRGGENRDIRRIVSHILDTIQFDGSGNDMPEVLKQVMDNSFSGSKQDIVASLFQLLSSK